MIDNSKEETGTDAVKTSSNRIRKKQKVKIKYRQRVKLLQRPKGYKIKRFLKKNGTKLIAYFIIASLLGGSVYLIVQLGKQKIEMNQSKRRKRQADQ